MPDPMSPMRGWALWRLNPLQSLALALALVVFLADQASKHWVSQHLIGGLERPLVPGLFRLQLVTNTGAAFSLFSGSTRLLGVVSLLVAVGMLLWILSRNPTGRAQALAAGLLLGGAAGNGLDRWRLGSVVDFLAFQPMAFPVFNLADVAINLAVLCYAIALLRPPGARHG